MKIIIKPNLLNIEIDRHVHIYPEPKIKTELNQTKPLFLVLFASYQLSK